MEQFSPIEYLAIGIANAKGLDKMLWKDRISWVKDNKANLEDLEPEGSDKFLYRKGVRALRLTEKGIPVNYIMDLDATNSGVQVMGAITKCTTSAYNSNVLGKSRNDVYGKIMDGIHGVSLTRKEVKEAAIPALYGSRAEPSALLGEDSPELKAFWEGLYSAVPALKFLSQLGKNLWNADAIEHSWTLPDGHRAICRNILKSKFKVNLQDGNSFYYEYKDIGYSENYIPLIVNIIHSIDAYIAREMVRRAKRQGFQLAHIHDSYWSHPKWMNHVRHNYIEILLDLAKSDILNNIAGEIKPGYKINFSDTENNMWKGIIDSEYALS